MTWARIQGDAFNLPLADASIDVVIADPPYEPSTPKRDPRGKRGLSFAKAGYVPFSGREWLPEAERVLKPTGHLYIVIPVRELADYLALRPGPTDIIAWHSPNAASLSAFWRRGIGGRAPTWRPILHYRMPDALPLTWPGGFVQGNHVRESQVLSNMHEALPWPNQLPERLLRYLLAPHGGALVLDLFAGSGTTGRACNALGLTCVSVDMSEKALAVSQLRGVTPPMLGQLEVTS